MSLRDTDQVLSISLCCFMVETWTPGLTISESCIKKIFSEDFLRGSVVKNLPANAGDVGSIPGPGRSHMLQGT